MSPPPPPHFPYSTFLSGILLGVLLTLYTIFTLYNPGEHQWGTKGCGLPFRAWNVKLSRIDVVVELTAHTTHIHLPFLHYILTHSLPWSLLLILLFEVFEWTLNALRLYPSLHTYDDPLDDFLQGIVGVTWALSLTKINAWEPWAKDTEGEGTKNNRKRVMLGLYAGAYSVGCSVCMGSAWYLPRTIGLTLYTLWSTLLLLPLPHIFKVNGRAVKYTAMVTVCYGGVMTAGDRMWVQNIGILVLAVASVVGGGVGREGNGVGERWNIWVERIIGIGVIMNTLLLAYELQIFMDEDISMESFLYPLPSLT